MPKIPDSGYRLEDPYGINNLSFTMRNVQPVSLDFSEQFSSQSYAMDGNLANGNDVDGGGWDLNITGEDVLDTALDFVPIVGGVKDIYKGVRDGNWWDVALGVGSIVADVVTLGSSSLVKGVVKTGIKAGTRAYVKKAANKAINGVASQYTGVVSRQAAKTGNTALKKILPSYKRINIDIGHIVSGHTKTGSRALQSGNKTVFGNLSNDQVQRLVRDAYKNVSKKLHTQGDRIKVRGSSGGYTIDMWINRATNTIETAYPIGL